MAEHSMTETWDRTVYPVPPAWQPRIVEEAETTLHEQQSAAEGVLVDEFDTVEFFGEKFRLAEKVGMMPLLAFGNAAKRGLDSDDFEGMAAMYRLIRSVIHRPFLVDEHGTRQVGDDGRPVRDETEWERFVNLADDESAEGEDIMAFVNRAMEVMSARPTQRPGISSASSETASESSRAGSSSLATRVPEGLTRVADL